jgi:hypothetical protein
MDKKTGMPTAKSLEKLLAAVSKKAGKGTKVEGTYVKSDDYAGMVDYAEGRLKQNKDPKRESYGILGNNCGTFCQDVLEAGGEDAPMMIDPRPNSYIGELEGKYENTIVFDPKLKKDKLKIEHE